MSKITFVTSRFPSSPKFCIPNRRFDSYNGNSFRPPGPVEYLVLAARRANRSSRAELETVLPPVFGKETSSTPPKAMCVLASLSKHN